MKQYEEKSKKYKEPWKFVAKAIGVVFLLSFIGAFVVRDCDRVKQFKKKRAEAEQSQQYRETKRLVKGIEDGSFPKTFSTDELNEIILRTIPEVAVGVDERRLKDILYKADIERIIGTYVGNRFQGRVYEKLESVQNKQLDLDVKYDGLLEDEIYIRRMGIDILQHMRLHDYNITGTTEDEVDEKEVEECEKRKELDTIVTDSIGETKEIVEGGEATDTGQDKVTTPETKITRRQEKEPEKIDQLPEHGIVQTVDQVFDYLVNREKDLDYSRTKYETLHHPAEDFDYYFGKEKIFGHVRYRLTMIRSDHETIELCMGENGEFDFLGLRMLNEKRLELRYFNLDVFNIFYPGFDEPIKEAKKYLGDCLKEID